MCVAAGLVMVGYIESAAAAAAAGSGANTFASPKSSTFTVPSGRTLIFGVSDLDE